MIAVAALALTLHLSSGGLDRTYRVYRPSSIAQGARVPLVVVLHGGYGSGAQAERAYGWDQQAERGRFLVAYPDGYRRSWNAGMCCGPAKSRKVDDVGFITGVVRQIERTQNADPNRVYITGMSNGAMMAYRLACDAPFPIAGIGSVAGTLDMEACVHPQRTKIVEIHGLTDAHVPFNGGVGINHPQPQAFPSVEDTLVVWRRANGCDSRASTLNYGVVTTKRWNCSTDNLELITIANAGHEWPGGKRGPRGALLAPLLHIAPADPVSDVINATETLWKFFNSAK